MDFHQDQFDLGRKTFDDYRLIM